MTGVGLQQRVAVLCWQALCLNALPVHLSDRFQKGGPFFDPFSERFGFLFRIFFWRLFGVSFGAHFGSDFRSILGPFRCPNHTKRGGPSEIVRNPSLGSRKGAFLRVSFRRFRDAFWGGWKSFKSTYLRWILTILAFIFDFFPGALLVPILAPIWWSFWNDFWSILGSPTGFSRPNRPGSKIRCDLHSF